MPQDLMQDRKEINPGRDRLNQQKHCDLPWGFDQTPYSFADTILTL
jgi:hypothetical protein